MECLRECLGVDLGSVIRSCRAKVILSSFWFNLIFAMRVYTVSIANCMQMKIILHASILDAGLRFNKIIWFVLCQSVVFLSVLFFFFSILFCLWCNFATLLVLLKGSFGVFESFAVQQFSRQSKWRLNSGREQEKTSKWFAESEREGTSRRALWFVSFVW